MDIKTKYNSLLKSFTGRTMVLILLILSITVIGSYRLSYGSTCDSLEISPEHLPTSGLCKVWNPVIPPGHQGPPVSCECIHLESSSELCLINHYGAVIDCDGTSDDYCCDDDDDCDDNDDCGNDDDCKDKSDLSITKSNLPDPAVVGQYLTYSIEITNEGPDTAKDVTLTDVIPQSVEFVSLSNCYDVEEEGDEEEGVITCTVDSLKEDESVTVEMVVIPTESRTITNVATVHSDSVDPNLSNNTITKDTEVIELSNDSPWVLLVYLAADNDLDNPDYNVIRDKEAFNALKRAVYLNSDVNIYVQWDRSENHGDNDPDDSTRRYHVLSDLNPFELADYKEGVTTWNMGEQNMGDPQVLYEFILWARGLYSSEHDALSIIGHGGGWFPTFDPLLGYNNSLPAGIVWDESSGDYLSTKELGESLHWATDGQVNPFEVIFLDASMMAMLENAYEIMNSAAYLVALENGVWARFPYDKYLDRVDETTTAREFATKIVKEYIGFIRRISTDNGRDSKRN